MTRPVYVISADLRGPMGERLATAGILTTLSTGYEVATEDRHGNFEQYRITETQAQRLVDRLASGNLTMVDRCLAGVLDLWWKQS